jgi:hypothetical protein
VVAAESGRQAFRVACGVVSVVLMLAGCTQLRVARPASWHPHLPWRHAPAGPEPLVNELVVATAPGAAAPALPQAWDRNALRVDMGAVSGEGELTLRPLQGHGWPIRLEFGVQPGSFSHLEIRGEQRVILSVASTGPVSTLAVPQGTYAPATRELVVHYGP